MTQVPGSVVALLLCTMLAFGTSCGGDVVGAAAPDSGTLADSGAPIRTSGSRAVAGPRTRCPTVAPATGSVCDREDLSCSYGSSPRWDCRRQLLCQRGLWQESRPPCAAYAECLPQPTPEAACEPSFGRALACERGASLCACFNCDRFSPQSDTCATTGPIWQCYAAPLDLDCPAPAPNIGEGCSTQGKTCTYGEPCDPSGVTLLCRRGEWERGGAACGQ